MQQVKGISSRKMLVEFKTLPNQFWDRHLWARGYFVASSGNVTDKVIMKYIEEQELDKPNDDFKSCKPATAGAHSGRPFTKKCARCGSEQAERHSNLNAGNPAMG